MKFQTARKLLLIESIFLAFFLWINFLVVFVIQLHILKKTTHLIVQEGSGIWSQMINADYQIRTDIPVIILFYETKIETPQNEIWIDLKTSGRIITGDYEEYDLYRNDIRQNHYYLNIEDILRKKKYHIEITDEFGNRIEKDIIVEHNTDFDWILGNYDYEVVPVEEYSDIIVNKIYSLQFNYVPEDLVLLSNYDIPATISGIELRKIVVNDLSNMISDAEKDGIELFIISGYRSFMAQYYLYGNNLYYYGFDETNMKVAKPGHSEHQLGTAVDITSAEILERKFLAFEETKASKWLDKNAYRYGFVLSYPKKATEKTGYIYEPWHYRYLGSDLAEKVYNDKRIFTEYMEDNYLNSSYYE